MPKAPGWEERAIYIGIDPGKSGGVSVIVSNYNMKLIITESLDLGLNTFKMPETEIDLINLFTGFKSDKYIYSLYAVVEKVGGYVGKKQSGSMMFNFGFIVGAARTACLAAGISLEEVIPRTWQKSFGIAPRDKAESDNQWKNRLRGHAQRLFPKENIILQVADSVLIAEYCRRKRTGTL